MSDSSNFRVTAKVTCQNNSNGYSPDYRTVTFSPDYQDGRNAEWAAATPSLSLTMNVKNSVAEHFQVGGKYTLTFEQNED